MAESAALLVDEVLPEQPMRQWVLSVPYPLRFLFASRPAIMTGVLSIVYRAIATHLIHKAGYTRRTARIRRINPLLFKKSTVIVPLLIATHPIPMTTSF